MKLFLFSSLDVVGISLIVAFLYGHPGEKVPEGIYLQLETGAVQMQICVLALESCLSGSSALMYVNVFDGVNTRKP